MITRAQIRRQLRAQGGITNVTPREGFFLGGLKKRIRKLIPNELASVASAAAPFVAPFNPAVAAAMAGLGGFDRTGNIGSALKSAGLTYGLGQGARFLGGGRQQLQGNPFAPDRGAFRGGLEGFKGGFSSPLSSDNMAKVFGTPTGKIAGPVEGVLGTGRAATEGILGKLGLTEGEGSLKLTGLGKISAASLASYFIAKGATPEEAKDLTQDVYRGEGIGFDQIREDIKKYRSGVLSQKQMFDKNYRFLVPRGSFRAAEGGRAGYQTGGISMGNTLAQNIAANKAQAQAVQQVMQQARTKLPEEIKTAYGITSVPTQQAMPTAMRANIGDLTRSFDPGGRSDARDSLFGGPPSGGQITSSSQKPIDYSTIEQTPGPPPPVPGMAGTNPEDFFKLSEAEQMKIMDAEVAREEAEMKKYGSFADGRTIDPRMGRSSYNDLLNVFKFDFPQVQLTGNETLAELDTMLSKLSGYKDGGRIGFNEGDLSKDKVYQKWVKRYEKNPDSPLVTMHENFNKYKNFYEQTKRAEQAQGGRIRYAMGTGLQGIPTGDMRRNRMGVMERDYRDKGGFVPVGVKEKADDVPAMLSKNEFVMTADAVRAAGGGRINKGAQRMYDTMKRLEGRVR